MRLVLMVRMQGCHNVKQFLLHHKREQCTSVSCIQAGSYQKLLFLLKKNGVQLREAMLSTEANDSRK